MLVVVDNAGSARSLGAELELRAQPRPALEFDAGLGYIDFHFRQLDADVLEVDLGSEQPMTPRWTANVGVQYTWPQGRYGRFRVRSDWLYQSRSYPDAGNTAAIARSAGGILDARLTFESRQGDWEVALFGTNLLDERFVANGVSALTSLGTATGFFNRPREWGLSLRREF